MGSDSKNDKTDGKIIAFPGAKRSPSAAGLTPEEATFKGFHLLVASGEVPAASQMLGTLLGIPLDASLKASHYYAEHFAGDNSHVFKTMAIRSELAAGLNNSVLQLLRECFGLEGPVAVVALQCLKDNLYKT